MSKLLFPKYLTITYEYQPFKSNLIIYFSSYQKNFYGADKKLTGLTWASD